MCLPVKCSFLRFSLSYTLPISTERTPTDDRENSDSTPCLQKSTFLKIGFLKKLSAFLKRLTKDLKRLTQHLTKFTHFEVYFAVPPAKFSHLYTLHFTPYTRKIALKCDFSCISANFIVPLHREPAPGMSVHRQRRVADILKRRLLRSVLTIRNLANFSCVQDLATIDVLRDIELSLLCQLWYVFCAYTYAHTRTLTTNIARE